MAHGQAGNTGAQALAVTQRGLALREIRNSHAWRVLSMTIAAVSGSIIPIVLTALGRDPASSILLSAVTDTMGFFGARDLMLHALLPE